MSISIEEDLVLLDVAAKDKFDLLSQVADRLFEKGMSSQVIKMQ